jgi:radical SAM superfamily enzyme YgiQ (UPF0313 family)
MFGRKVRRQSPAKVEADLRVHMGRGFRDVFFYDDNLLADRAWAKDMLARIAPLKIHWRGQARVDLHWIDRAAGRRDDALLKLMQRSGADLLFVGYETIDDRTAANWGKGYQGRTALRRRLLEDTRILHEQGIWIHAMFMLAPHHRRQEIDRVIQFAGAARIETLQMSILTPLPGTPVFEQMRPDLFLTDFPGDWDYYDGTHCVYRHGQMGVAELQQAVMDAHRRFYRDPACTLQRMAKMLRVRAPLGEKLAMFWQHVAMGRDIFDQWRSETREFLEHVRRQGENVLLHTRPARAAEAMG